MDPTRGQPASALLNRLSEPELADALLELGDETDAPKIARLIVERAVPPRHHHRAAHRDRLRGRDTRGSVPPAATPPAARISSACILVNRELANLDRLLAVISQSLAPGGVAAIISFHSGEDRRVKDAFRTGLRAGVCARSAEIDRRRRTSARIRAPVPPSCGRRGP